jgi:hypothetical protein
MNNKKKREEESKDSPRGSIKSDQDKQEDGGD